MKPIFNIIALFLLVPTMVCANEFKGKHTKTKTITKEYTVSANATLDLDNKYGSIDIKSWDQNKVTIEVIITTNSNNESKAQDRLDDIDVVFNASNSLVAAKTQIGKSNNWNWGRNNNSVNMDIQYIVRMPKSNDLVVDMDYGDVMIDALDGKADINCDYGKLIAGELNGSGNDINLDYSSGSTIDYLNNADINIDYTTIDVDKAGDVSLNGDYCSSTFGEVKNLNFNCDYGNLNVDNANSIDGNSDYTNLKFGKIASRLMIEADYGNLKVDEMGENFSLVNVNTEYIGVKIGVHSNSSFTLKVESQYGGINVPEAVDITSQIEKNSNKKIEGTYNGGSKGKINISTQYGSIKIMNN